MAELGQQTVEFSTLVSRAAEDSFLSLKELVEKSKSSEMSDSEKKISILKYLVKTQQRMLRLNVLTKWCQQVPLIQYCQQLTSTLSSHDTCFTQAADSMFFMHEGLQQARAPIYDVPSSIEILLTGTYERLPKCVEDLGMQGALTKDQQKPALEKLDVLVKSKLLDVSLPKEISEVKVSNGTALIRVDGEFKVLVTLGYRGHMSMWRILHLDLLVGDQSGPIKLELTRRHILGDDLERRMAASENPFGTLYNVLHELCVSLVMDTVIKQVRSLIQGRWKDAIRFELITYGSAGSMQLTQDGEVDSAGVRTPGLKILYWLDFDKKLSDGVSCPYIKVEPGVDLQIKCIHSTFVIDPQTTKEAEFLIDQSCIDIEKLLLKAICCNRYTRLFEIYKELRKNGHLCRALGDVLLHCLGDEHTDNKQTGNKSNAEGKEVLRVCAYGSSFFTLGINIRNGRFLLQSSKNVLSSSALLECEDALNDGVMTAGEVFISLRTKSILHLFACIGRFLGLQVYEHGFSAMKVPKNALTGSNMILMGFPECGRSYFLLMQLDKDFKPIFKLLETQPDSSIKSQSLSDSNSVIRIKNIDIAKMQMLEDELNLSLDSAKLLSLPTNSVSDNRQTTDEQNPLAECNSEGSVANSGRSTSFSSIVDKVFELEKGSSAPHFSHFGSSASLKHQNSTRAMSVGPSYSGSPYKGLVQSSSATALSSVPGQSALKRLSDSKSEQDLASLRPPHSAEVGSYTSMDEDQLNVVQSRSTGWALPISSVPGSSTWVTAPISEVQDSSIIPVSDLDAIPKQDTLSRKRTLSDMLDLVHSLQSVEVGSQLSKRRKMVEPVISSAISGKTEGYSYAHLIAEANKGNTPSSIYISALLHVVRHCSLCIKHAHLTSQMDALDIPYVEEVGLRNSSSNLWFRLPFARVDTWQYICLRLGRPGSMHWDVKINDQHFRDLWELQKGGSSMVWGSGVRIANTSDIDSHIRYDHEGVVLSYNSVEVDSIKKLLADIQRLSNARMFALGMRKLLGVKLDDKFEESNGKGSSFEAADRRMEQMRRSFRIEAVGLMSLWFSFGSGVLTRFVVEWESGKDGCTMHVSPDQLWPHTKFLEDFINGAEVASLLDCIRLTAGPLQALAAATRPARAAPIPVVPGVAANFPIPKNHLSTTSMINIPQASLGPGLAAIPFTTAATHSHHGAAMLAAAASRGGPGIVPSSLLPIDVSVVLRGPYWIRIIYRKKFAVDMRCFAGDQVWLQPATPPTGGPSVGGSLPCPQFRPFIMEHVAQELNGLDPNFTPGQQTGGQAATPNNSSPSSGPAPSGYRPLPTRSGNQVAGLGRDGNGLPPATSLGVVSSGGVPLRKPPAAGVPAHVRGELNTAIIGLGDDGGYGGGWVPLVALKKVLRGILKYLGVLWLFAQLPDILKEILGSILKDNEGALLNLDQEQPALRFFVGGYVFAVSVHRVQLLLQVLSVKRFHHSHQQQQQQQNASISPEELTQSEISEICDYFCRRVASEPYDASRVASFITLLTLPISVLREFLKLIAWKKGLAQSQGSCEIAPAQKSRIELCLENHSGLDMDGDSEKSFATKSNIHYDRPHNSVDFGLTVVLDTAHILHINAAGGAAWLPYCVSVRLRYSFGENPSVGFLGMEGSHGGRACWLRVDDWDKCKQRVVRTVEMNTYSATDVNQGRLRMVADSVQRTLHGCLQELREAM